MTDARRARDGLVMAVVAYGLWGLFPIYWKQLAGVPATEVLAHRVVWSLVFVLTIVVLRRQLGRVVAVLRSPRARRSMLLSTSLVGLNWGVFIWAVSENRVAEASLGYYINPLVNVALGRAVLGERLSRGQGVAIAIAGLAVAGLTLAQGRLPWVSLLLAVSFGFYGLVRKRVEAGALDGLTIETGFAAPVALAYLLMLDPAFGHLAAPTSDGHVVGFLLGAGVATSIPLLAFAGAARRLRYTTLGMIQYLAPTLQLACAVGLYGEPLTLEQGLTFGGIWLAIGIYIADARPWRAAGGRVQREPVS
ncbi:MAG: EamA family transporter RarD [Myxococcota bacterium]